MAFEDYKTKDSVVVVYTGNSKGKTSASIGLMARALGRGWKVAYIQFIKEWETGEQLFIEKILPVFEGKLDYNKGGKGFYNARDLSAKDVSDAEHRAAARNTYDYAFRCATSGKYDLVICDEISNAVYHNLIEEKLLLELLEKRHKKTSICLTGRNFPEALLEHTDIATNMVKLKHHFDEKYLANEGIDY